MLTYRNVLEFITFVIIITVILTFPASQIYASENVKWKTFKEKNGLFTIKYPSNWFPSKFDEATGLIDMYFFHEGKGSSFARVDLYAGESIFTNIIDKMDSYTTAIQNLKNYEIIRSVECGKYKIDVMPACSQIESFSLEIDDYPDPLIRQLTIVTIDQDGTEYVIQYGAPVKQFDKFIPIAEEMIKSFTITGSSPSLPPIDEESTSATDDLPELPPLSKSHPTILL